MCTGSNFVPVCAAATNDSDVNDIFGKGGSHTAPNTVQTGGQRSDQIGGQSSGRGNGQSGGQTSGQAAAKAPSGAPSSGSTGTNFGQGI